MDPTDETLQCIAAQIYCSSQNRATTRNEALALIGFGALQMLYFGSKWDQYSDDLNDKLKAYRADLKCEEEHYCDEGAGTFAVINKAMLTACSTDTAMVMIDAIKTKAFSTEAAFEKSADQYTKYGLPQRYSCSVYKGAMACAIVSSSEYAKEFNRERSENWAISNIELMAEITRGQRQNTTQLKNVRQVAISTCETMMNEAGNSVTTGGTLAGTGLGLYSQATS